MAESHVTPDDIDTDLDRPLTKSEHDRIERWIDETVAIIELRTPADAVPPDHALVDFVVRSAVEYRWRMRERQDGASSVTVSADDASITKQYAGSGLRGGWWWILPEWWELLFPVKLSGAFSTRPGYVPDSAPIVEYHYGPWR